MRTAILTAALQEPPKTSRQQFVKDPMATSLTALSWWIRMGGRLECDLEVGAALAYKDSYVDPKSMIDRVAAHLPLRTPRTGKGTDLSQADAKGIITLCRDNKVRICDVAFFDNPLHDNKTIRNQVHEHLFRCGRAAVELAPVGCDGVAGFIGRNFKLSPDQNLAWFEKVFIPILKRFKKMGIKFYAENCPMPGWSTGEMFMHNLASNAYFLIRICILCEKHGVLDQFRITYDESHDILQGTTHHATFAALKAAGYAHVLVRLHAKNQYRDHALVALHTGRGAIAGLGCELNGKPHPDPVKRLGAWGKMPCAHGQVGIGQYNPQAMWEGAEADWFDQQYALRDYMKLDTGISYNILEHEFGPARQQDPVLIEGMLRISVAYAKHIDGAADALYRSKLWCKAHGLPLPGSPNPKYVIAGLNKKVDSILLEYKV